MTYLQIRQRIAELMGQSSTDTTPDANATMQDKLKAWVNDRYKALAGKESWNWLIKDFIVQTVEEITTGTVTATTDSTTITFTSGPAASVTGYFIQFSDTDDWYEIESHTAAATTAVLTKAFLGTTSSSLTYILRKVYYALPSDTGKILNVRQARTKGALHYLPIRQLDLMVPDRTHTGTPEIYTIAGVDSDRLYKMELYPVPNEKMNIQGRYYRVVSDLSADADIPILPAEYHGLLVWDVLQTYGYLFLDDTRLSAAKAEYNTLFKDMKRNCVETEDIAVRSPYDVDLVQMNNPLSQQTLPIV